MWSTHACEKALEILYSLASQSIHNHKDLLDRQALERALRESIMINHLRRYGSAQPSRQIMYMQDAAAVQVQLQGRFSRHTGRKCIRHALPYSSLKDDITVTEVTSRRVPPWCLLVFFLLLKVGFALLFTTFLSLSFFLTASL